MTAPRFDAFVLLAEMRTGSNHLEASLAALDGVTCYGEVFNPVFLGAHNRTELLGVDMAARDADPLRLLARICEGEGLPGFRFFHDHDPRVIDAVLPDPRVAKIVLTRDPLEAFVSLRIAQETGQWRLTNPGRARTARVSFDGAAFDEMVARQDAFHARVDRALQVTGQAAFRLDYAQIGDLEVVNGIAAFLGLPARLEALPGKLKRQNPGAVEDKVDNPDAMRAHLAARAAARAEGLPAMEAAPGARVPAMLAGRDRLFLPVPGGPTEAVRAWMTARDGAPPREGLSQKDLRAWLRGTPGHQSFAVVTHPLHRAWRVLRDEVLPRGGGPARRLLARHYEAPLPDDPATADPAALRDCLLAFLRFAKANMGGQTALPPGPRWGHQLAAIQGMAQVVPPMRVLRGLSALEDGPGDAPYDGPADDRVVALAESVWRRDYLTFGFPPEP